MTALLARSVLRLRAPPRLAGLVTQGTQPCLAWAFPRKGKHQTRQGRQAGVRGSCGASPASVLPVGRKMPMCPARTPPTHRPLDDVAYANI